LRSFDHYGHPVLLSEMERCFDSLQGLCYLFPPMGRPEQPLKLPPPVKEVGHGEGKVKEGRFLHRKIEISPFPPPSFLDPRQFRL
jgi:hypothetical protein